MEANLVKFERVRRNNKSIVGCKNIKLKVDKNTRIFRNILETRTFMSEPEPLTDPEPSKQNEQEQETVAISLKTS